MRPSHRRMEVNATVREDSTDPGSGLNEQGLDAVSPGSADGSVAGAEELDIDSSVDFGDLASTHPELADLFADQPTPVMPDAVWQRLSAALAQETPLMQAGTQADTQADTAAASAGASIHHIDQARTTHSGADRTRRRGPLLAAAASLVLIGAVGIPVVLNSGTSPPPPVADGAPIVASQTPEVATETTTQPDLGAAEPSTAPKITDTVPAQIVVASGINYDGDAMSTQVADLLGTAGVVSAPMPDLSDPSMADPDSMLMVDEVVSAASSTPTGYPPMIGSAGFTADVDEMRKCVELLKAFLSTKMAPEPVTTMPALVVDRASYQGADSGVVVWLNDRGNGASRLDVAVVRPTCTAADVDQAMWFSYDLP